MAEMAHVLTADLPAGDKLKKLVRQLTADMQEMNIYQSIALEFYALAGRREEVRQSLLAYFRDFQLGLAGLIQQGIDSGEFRPIDASLAASIFIAQMEGIALLWALNPDQIKLEETIGTAVELIIDGLSTHPQQP
jgi:hypothetical protein